MMSSRALFIVLLFVVNGFSVTASADNKKAPTPTTPTKEALTIIVDSPYAFEETVKRLQETIRSYNYRVFPNRFLEQGLTNKFSVNQKQVVVRFCNFNMLYKSLKDEPRLGIILPCKITVIEKENGTVQLLYANINVLSKLFHNDKLKKAAIQIEESYSDIIDEVTL
ncbi:MAG: DUF302 domain-containing protein [Cocleimonas sp.]